MAKIFEPISIGTMQLKNRIVSLPTVTNFADRKGYSTYQQVEAYRRRAQGGAALIIVEASYMRQDGRLFSGMHGVYDDRMLPYLNDIVEAIHEMGSKACIQIAHGGRQSSPRFTGLPVVAPSPHPHPFWPGRDYDSRAMAKWEVEQILEQYFDAVMLAKEAGFDSVELHSAHGYLIHQFLSPHINRRDDEFGEPLTFPLRLIRGCKEVCGKNFPIIIRLSVDDKIQEIGIEATGLTYKQTKQYIPKLIDAGVDCFDLSHGTCETLNYNVEPIYFTPGGRIRTEFNPIKEISTVPVIARGRVNDPRLAIKIIEDGQVDLIGMARQLIADPYTPKKMMEGRYKDVRRCIACDIGCLERLFNQVRIRCAINYNFGMEYREYYRLPPVRNPKKVLVVGAGPGGLEAARVCAERGHSVIVWERQSEVGGMAKLASATPSILTRDLWHIIPWLERQCSDLDVDIMLNKEATLESIDEDNWDAIILATGSSLLEARIPGQEMFNLLYLNDYYFSHSPIGKTVVVIGGQEGAEAACSLAREGKEVVLLSETGDYADANYLYALRKLTLQQMMAKQKNLMVLTGIKIQKFTSEGLLLTNKGGEERKLGAETFLVGLGRKSNRELCGALLLKQRSNIFEIGDCKQPRRIMEAMHEANSVARMIN